MSDKMSATAALFINGEQDGDAVPCEMVATELGDSVMWEPAAALVFRSSRSGAPCVRFYDQAGAQIGAALILGDAQAGGYVTVDAADK